MVSLEQTQHIPCLDIKVNVHEARSRGQTRNSHDITSQGIEESSTGTRTNLSDRHSESGGNTLSGRVATERVLCLGHANWKLAKSGLFVLLNLRLCQLSIVNAVGSVNFLANDFNFFLDW